MILYLCADLLWATRVKSAAEDLGIPARPVRSMEMLEARLADSEVRGLIVDLEAGPVGLEMIRRVVGFRDGVGDRAEAVTGDGAIRVVAFGPHVEVEALEAAQQAGARRVMARGAFAKGLGGVLRGLEMGDLDG